jgi:5-methylthioadenosine/S-adenosylhomocysteine deaminase
VSKKLLKVGRIVTMDPLRRVLHRGGLVLEGTRITEVLSADELASASPFAGEVIDAPRLTAIPGFVQTHVHLCQTLFRGLADDLDLLDWLRLRIFPLESAHTPSSLRASALLGIAELVRSGTTTIMDMGTISHQDEIAGAVEESGVRAFVGKAMMDVNTMVPSFRESTDEAISSTLKLAETWHDTAGGRIRYAVAPRFVLSCTDALVREAYALTQSFPGMLFHTHAAENRREMDAVRERCGMGNIDYLDAAGVLHANTCLAHCIWVGEGEIARLRRSKAKVLHCPSSNLKLGSGIAPIPKFLQHKIVVSLGADGAPCNNRLDMFAEMRLAALVQKPHRGPTALPAETVFEIATLGGALTLGLETEIGSLEVGKKADIVLLDLAGVWNSVAPESVDNVYSSIVYSGTPENVHSVIVDGIWLYRDGVALTIDEHRVRQNAGVELEALLARANL